MAETFRREIDLGDGGGKQVFEGTTMDELADKLASAQVHASKKIREQNQSLQQREQELTDLQARMTPQSEPVPEGQFDKQKWFATLYEDPMRANDAYMEQRFGMPVDQLKDRLQRMDLAAEQVNIRTAAASLTARHPELLKVAPEDDIANGRAIDTIMREAGWNVTEQNMEAAYLLAKDRGKLKLPTATEPAPVDEPPVTLGTTGSTNGGFNEEEFKRTATAEQWKGYLKQKYAGARA